MTNLEGRARAQAAVENMMAEEVETLRSDLIQRLDDDSVSMVQFMEHAVVFWRKWLSVDRIFVCDMRSGDVVAGWNKGNNIARLQDWDSDYVPLESDTVIQRALESDELIASPTPGVGADLAFSLPLDDGDVWLIAMDQTDTARVFTKLDMAYIALVRDLAVIKSRLRPGHGR